MCVGRGLLWAETVAIFVVFFLQGAVPVPDINEPYYLGKAAHFWDSASAQGDFFLESKDTHQVFYFTFGWLAKWLPLGAMAWVGRIVTWGLLAWAWRRMNHALLRRPWIGILTAAWFGALMQYCHFSGEWVIGGVEAKGFAFVLVFLAVEALARNRWNRVWLLLGAASAFHVLVGGWSVVAAGLAWLWLWVSRSQRPSLLSMGPALLGGFLLSLPGLISALRINQGADPAAIESAHLIYVYERLSHHLVPMLSFPPFYYRVGILLTAWTVLCCIAPRDDRTGRLKALVGGSIIIAAIGGLLSYLSQFDQPRAAELLRFYWFRLADVVLPLGIAVLAGGTIVGQLVRRKTLGRIVLGVGITVAAVHLGIHAVRLVQPAPPKAFRLADWFAWRDACLWVNEPGNIPPDARFITPRMNQTFKWYAGRAEVANWKEVPQDARALVKWWERMNRLHGTGSPDAADRWHGSLLEPHRSQAGRIDRREYVELQARWLKDMGVRYGADYVITYADPRLPLPVVYPEGEYPRDRRATVIYRLSDE